MATMLSKDGTVIEAGDWVAGGYGEDADWGEAFERNDQLWVAWEGGACQTPLGEGQDVAVYPPTWIGEKLARADAAARREGAR